MRKILLWLINIYQMMPLSCHQACRFTPSCSEYTKEAIIKYGAFKGGVMGVKRILRCHPFGKYGYDPVKEEKK